MFPMRCCTLNIVIFDNNVVSSNIGNYDNNVAVLIIKTSAGC